jgi:hypothetical protein
MFESVFRKIGMEIARYLNGNRQKTLWASRIVYNMWEDGQWIARDSAPKLGETMVNALFPTYFLTVSLG